MLETNAMVIKKKVMQQKHERGIIIQQKCVQFFE